MPRRSATSPAVGRQALNSFGPLQSCLALRLCLVAKSPREMLGYMALHRPLDQWALSCTLRKIYSHAIVQPSSTHGAGLTQWHWKQNWSNVKPGCLEETGGRWWRIFLLRLHSELRILALFVSFLACSFLVSGNMQKCKNSQLGVNFEQLLGQESPTSCLTDCMMTCLHGPEFAGEFQLLASLWIPYFQSFYHLCLQLDLQVLRTPTEYHQRAFYICAYMEISCQKSLCLVTAEQHLKYLLLGLKMKKALASGMGTAFSLRCSSDIGRGRGPTGISGSSSSSSAAINIFIISHKMLYVMQNTTPHGVLGHLFLSK